jgi:hypothetical protein
MSTDFRIRTQEGEYDIEAHVRRIGSDLLVAVWGGERPHIGAVSIAQPRPSLRDASLTSSTASVLCLLGHKEGELAKALAEKLAATLNTNVVVTAGIHWDDLNPADIRKIVRNAETLQEMILAELSTSP